MTGKFITIEGQDGAGKSTNIAAIASFLARNNIDFVTTREPGGTEFGETLRQLLLSSKDNIIGDMSELLLIFAARAQHIDAIIKPALAQEQWVLCDRFTDATYAYQGAGRALGFDAVGQLEQLVQGDLRPDLTLVLDLPVDVGVARAGQRSEPDRFEQQQLDFKQRVRDAYLEIADTQPERVKLINATESIEAVANQIITILEQFITFE